MVSNINILKIIDVGLVNTEKNSNFVITLTHEIYKSDEKINIIAIVRMWSCEWMQNP